MEIINTQLSSEGRIQRGTEKTGQGRGAFGGESAGSLQVGGKLRASSIVIGRFLAVTYMQACLCSAQRKLCTLVAHTSDFCSCEQTGKTYLGRHKSAKIFRTAIVVIMMVLCLGGIAWGQQALPYSYGFENNNLAAEGWTLNSCPTSTGIADNGYGPHTGDYLFRFYFNDDPPQYLISPELTGTGSGFELEFYYRNYSNSYPETFQVGYSTTTNAIASFTWGTEITARDEDNWQRYQNTFPAGTKYIAIRLNSNDQFYLFLDDFSFTASCAISRTLSIGNVPAGNTMVAGNSTTLTATPSAGAGHGTVTWSSSDASVVSVNASTGEITAEAEGTATITATISAVDGYCGATASVTINVSATSCLPPTNINVSDITSNAASVSWEGDADSYNIRWTEVDFATVTLTAHDVWGDGSGYQLLLDANANTYGTIIPATGPLSANADAPAATYAEFEYKIPANADGSRTTPNIVVDNSITIQIPAGTYDWCITNPEPGASVWIVGSGGRADDYVFEAGKNYEFVASLGIDGHDQININVTPITVTSGIPDHYDHTVSGISSIPYTITGLDECVTYAVQVQANCGGEGLSRWVGTTFNTCLYSAELVSIDLGSGDWCNGATRPVSVTFRNIGTQTWYNDGLTCECGTAGCLDDESHYHRTFLSYTWSGSNNFDNPTHGRIPLGRDVAPGETLTINLDITSEAEGSQNLMFWFRRSECEWFNTAPFAIPVTIMNDEAPTIAVNNVTCLNGLTQVVLTACTEDYCTWSVVEGTPGSAGGTNSTNYTVTPTEVHNIYQVLVGTCRNTIVFDLPVGTITVSPTTTDCNGHANLTASGNDGATYNWYDSNGDNVSSSNPYSVTLNEDATFQVNASYEQSPRTMVYGNSGRYVVPIPAGVTSVKLEVWGAQGGNGNGGDGGKGGYSVGMLTNLTGVNPLYIYVGGVGDTRRQSGSASGGFNGGGSGYSNSYNRFGGGGGGATHIALVDGELNDLTAEQRNNVLIVAGGGGGGGNAGKGGAGGGESGTRGTNNNNTYYGYGGTQTAGGAGGDYYNYDGYAGQMGLGGNSYQGDRGSGGGGGGWYGGGGGAYRYGGGGGSGYVKNTLSDRNTIAGNATMPNPNGGTMTGKTGNGYARITFYGQVCTSANTTVNVTSSGIDAEIQITNP